MQEIEKSAKPKIMRKYTQNTPRRHPGQVHLMHAIRDLWNVKHVTIFGDSRFRGNDNVEAGEPVVFLS
ncbi:MAG: hypothetical protein AAF228_03670 [Pseudomonadota bacterium]